MANAAQRGKLAYKILFWFLLISLAPMGVIGFHLVSLSQESLRKETEAMQESLAVGFADTVHKFVTTFRNVCVETAGLEDFASMNPARQQQYFNRIMQLHLAMLELSVINAQGVETMRTGRFLGPSPELRRFDGDELFNAAMARGQMIGKLERFQGLYPTLHIAVAIPDPKTARPVGVIFGKVSLNGLSQMLGMEFPLSAKTSAAVVAPDGFLIAHSNAKEVFKPEARMGDGVLKYITTQPAERGSGEISIGDGKSVLGSFADVRDLGWQVYVQQPLEQAYQAAEEMKAQIFRVLVIVVIVTMLLSLAVAGHITQPIRLLREAADRLGRGQFEDLPEIIMTNDEIGDLAQTFLAMSESLKEKTGELVGAKQKLEDFARLLEKRVKARERELDSAHVELVKKERLAAIGQMASVVSHEIRNPLAVIQNSIHFIKTKLSADGAEPDAKVSKHIKFIETEIQQANGIINEILTYARARELNPERVQLNAFIEDILSAYPIPAHITVEKVLSAPNDTPLDIDTTEVRQAVRNLMGNAIEVMPQSGTLHIRTSVDPEWATIMVGDSGPGMPPEVVEKIFAPFFTTKARGTGLGLAVVHKVMDRHKGKIEVESVVGKGTMFRLHLPVAQRVAPKV